MLSSMVFGGSAQSASHPTAYGLPTFTANVYGLPTEFGPSTAKPVPKFRRAPAKRPTVSAPQSDLQNEQVRNVLNQIREQQYDLVFNKWNKAPPGTSSSTAAARSASQASLNQNTWPFAPRPTPTAPAPPNRADIEQAKNQFLSKLGGQKETSISNPPPTSVSTVSRPMATLKVRSD